MRIDFGSYITRLKTGAAIGAVGAALAFSGASASADIVVPGQLINVDWNGNGGGPAPGNNPGTFDGDLSNGTFTADSVNFVDSDAANNDIWNGVADAEGVNASLSSVVDSAGTVVDGVTVSWAAFDGSYNNYSNRGDDITLGPNADVLVGNPGNADASVTISGLVANGSYDITAIAGFNISRYTIGGSSQIAAQFGGGNNPDNFVEFSSVTASADGDIVIGVDSAVGGRFDIGGLQITGDFGSVVGVPEPGSAAVLGVASLFGLLRRRRKNG